MKKRLTIILAKTIILFVVCACVKENVSIVGVWERQIDGYIVGLSFSEDETFFLQVGERDKVLFGEYEIRGDVILLIDDDCDDIEGKYRVETQESITRFRVLNDACEGRVEVVAGDWRRVGNQ